MKTSDFFYELPERLIAQTPVEPRDHSRLMVVNRATGEISHRHFYDITGYINPEDALVINETRVMPARLTGDRNGSPCEILLLKELTPTTWETIVKPGKKLRPGAVVTFGGGALTARIVDVTDQGGRIVAFDVKSGELEAAFDALGEMPLPPYIHEKLEDGDRYQTVYARRRGSAAAPTAGLHFTPELLGKIGDKGTDIVPVLLHIGLGTFRPVKVENVEDHHMHSEYYQVTPDAARRVNAARKRAGRAICVGTTSVRTLESSSTGEGELIPGSGDTEIFIKPGYRFKMVDALITNFHLPGSTLLMLVSAFMGRELALDAYEIAVKEEYRFFSFGDAMLII
ncbi:MAG: tRNA preQ1(34) S-adenosylmethionine ribosyltransferase-isomerase QueA [Clostridia bacterium]|nr:tRNA preQ1(34) S-adenosylmethionine ribosyltransferase-isomerase QueA [Clostridia bacterium]